MPLTSTLSSLSKWFLIAVALLFAAGCFQFGPIVPEEGSYVLRGIAYARRGQYDRAISYFTRSLEINPAFAAGYYYRGLAYMSKGQYEQALSDFNRALDINPSLTLAYEHRGQARKMMGDKEGARADLEKSIEYESNPSRKARIQSILQEIDK